MGVFFHILSTGTVGSGASRTTRYIAERDKDLTREGPGSRGRRGRERPVRGLAAPSAPGWEAASAIVSGPPDISAREPGAAAAAGRGGRRRRRRGRRGSPATPGEDWPCGGSPPGAIAVGSGGPLSSTAVSPAAGNRGGAARRAGPRRCRRRGGLGSCASGCASPAVPPAAGASSVGVWSATGASGKPAVSGGRRPRRRRRRRGGRCSPSCDGAIEESRLVERSSTVARGASLSRPGAGTLGRSSEEAGIGRFLEPR